MVKKGHKDTVIDSNPEAFEGLGPHFKGSKVVGIGFDKEVLDKAKIDKVDAVVSCTASDEANAVIARIARNIYQVPRVVARLYDARKAEIYHRIGIQTISTTTWGIERATEFITHNHLDSVYEMGNGSVNMLRIEVPALLVGHQVKEISALGEIQVTSISRGTRTFIPTLGTVMESEDILYLTVMGSATGKLKSMLGLN
jgi:trk system potassium uptake protein TrkA